MLLCPSFVGLVPSVSLSFLRVNLLTAMPGTVSADGFGLLPSDYRSLQQRFLPLSWLTNLGDWSQPWWRLSQPNRLDIWRSKCHLRSACRKDGCETIASTPAS